MPSTEQDSDDPRSEPVPRTVSEERSLTPMRKTIAQRLSESYREAVHVTVHRDVDAEPLLDAADAADAAHDVGVIDVLLQAVSATLSAHPSFNATFADGTHTIYEEHNVAVAVSLDAGLVTPVLSSLEEQSIAAIARDRRTLTDRVRAGNYSMSDFRGGTFTVSNLGPLGTDSFTPIIDPPQVAILGVNRIRDRATVVDGDVEARPEVGLDLSFDHRVVDGADAARFLGTLAEEIADGSR